MILCHCNAISDREVRAAVQSGATRVSEITAACGAAGDCGACHASIESVLDEQGVRVLVRSAR